MEGDGSSPASVDRPGKTVSKKEPSVDNFIIVDLLRLTRASMLQLPRKIGRILYVTTSSANILAPRLRDAARSKQLKEVECIFAKGREESEGVEIYT